MKRFLFVLAGSVASGLLLGLSLPPVNLSLLGWVCLVPLFWVVVGRSFLAGFFGGLITVVLPAILFAFGVMPVPFPSSGDPAWVFGGYLLFGAVVGVMAGIVAETKVLTFRRAIAYAAIAVVVEACLLPILPVHLALSQWQSPFAMRIASVTGIWGVSALLWFSSLYGAAVLKQRRYMLSVIVVALIGLSFVPWPGSSSASIKYSRIAVIQTSSADLPVLADLNRRAGALKARMVVWPELSALAAAPSGDTHALIDLSKQKDQPAFVTSFEDKYTPRPHNTAALFSAGTESDRYFKRRPFGGEITVHAPGSKPVYAKWEVPVGLNICFDSCDPGVMRESAQAADLGFIALPTEDPVAPGSVIQAIHAAYTPFRAAELGVTVARADITAYSLIAGPDGQPLTGLAQGQGVAATDIPPPHWTFYRQFGDWFLYCCVAVTLAVIVRGLLRRKRKPTASQTA